MPIKSVSIKLKDKKARHLRFEWSSLNRLEDELGYDIPQLMSDIASGSMGFNKLTKLIWAGLTWENEALTVKEVEGLLAPKDIAGYVEKVGEALNAAFLDEEAEKNEAGSNPNQKENGTGKTT